MNRQINKTAGYRQTRPIKHTMVDNASVKRTPMFANSN